jgi:hypothetical protein
MPPMFWMARRGRARAAAGVDQRHQRRALAAGGHVARAEVGDHGQAVRSAITAASPICRVAPLCRGARAVGGGLAVRGDEVHVGQRDARPGRTRRGGLGEALADQHVQLGQLAGVGLGQARRCARAGAAGKGG